MRQQLKSTFAVIKRPGATFFTIALCIGAAVSLSACKRRPDASTPKKAALALAKAVNEGDMDTVRLLATGTNAQFEMLKSMGSMKRSVEGFQAAAVKQFGDAAKISDFKITDMSADMENAEEKIDGDSATLVKSGVSVGKFKKDSNGWKMDLASTLPDSDPFQGGAKAMADAYDTVAKEVQSGKYKTVAEAHAAVQQKLAEKMMPH